LLQVEAGWLQVRQSLLGRVQLLGLARRQLPYM